MECRGMGRVWSEVMALPRPTTATEAAYRAHSIAGAGGQYVLGTGNYSPEIIPGGVRDLPWTKRESDGLVGCDCAGLVVWAYKVRRHRPGYNKGGRFDVEDDLNCNSMLGDAMGAQDLFTLVDSGLPQVGDVIAYPSFYLYDSYGHRMLHNGSPLHWIGHTCIVTDTGRVDHWDWKRPAWYQLDVAQCKGPDERAPGVVLTDGSIWSHHDSVWPKPEHRSWLIRGIP